mmetsp:Transcript_37750/g.60596  ORF Transcript_37750/g.60596 Transcript_37750/m.60596 type:complete len:683 (+) Transcript_37750:122-2170(+)
METMETLAKKTTSSSDPGKGKDKLGEFVHKKMGVFHQTTYQMQMRYYGKKEDENAHYFRSFIPKQHEEFYNKLPFTVLATIDDNGEIWASVTTAKPGRQLMVATPNDVTFTGIDELATHGDPVWKNIKAHRPIGMLGIEMHTRRRNRLNGVVGVSKSGHIQISGPIVSFGNCPQYITERTWHYRPQDQRREAKVTSVSSTFSQDHRNMMSSATTMFMGTGHPRTGVDASHRGGPAGFVRVVNNSTIMWPDFPGNQMLKSLSNVQENGKLGLWFGDFQSGKVLQMIGNGKILWADDAEDRKKISSLQKSAISKETARYPESFNWVVFEVKKIVERSDALSVSWLPRHDYIDLQVAKVVEESKDVKSFFLIRAALSPSSQNESDAKHKEARKEGGSTSEGSSSKKSRPLPAVIPGQYLPIFVNPSSHAYSRGANEKPLDRTYTISGSSEHHYRLTIKRIIPKGKVSAYFHDEVKEGSIIQAREPQGHFVLQHFVSDHNTRMAESPNDIVFISAGIGITPVLAILSDLVVKAESKTMISKSMPRVLWVYGSRTPEDLPHTLHKEAKELVTRYRGAGGQVHQHTQFSKILPSSSNESDGLLSSSGRFSYKRVEGETVGFGRLVPTGLQKLLQEKRIESGKKAHFYVCGPKGFMRMLSEGLSEKYKENVFSETFGPSAAAAAASTDK